MTVERDEADELCFISKRMMIKELTLANEKNFVFSF